MQVELGASALPGQAETCHVLTRQVERRDGGLQNSLPLLHADLERLQLRGRGYRLLSHGPTALLELPPGAPPLLERIA